MATGKALCSPCGGCRQKIAEFALPDALIRLYSPDALRAVFSLAKLLPHSFTAEHLKIGNVSDHRLDTILSDRNPALQKMIDEQMTGDFGDVCKSCTAYQSIYDVRRTGISLKDWRKSTN